MHQNSPDALSLSPAAKLGFVLTRFVTPLWVLVGATFKLVERTPKNLPKGIWQPAVDAGIDLHVLLATLIVIEFAMAGVMFFVPRLARWAAIFMLSVFCVTLLNEMRLGNFTSCGCLGKIPIKPWQMLAIDGTLLLGVIALGRFIPATRRSPLGSLGAAALPIAGLIACVLWVLPQRAGANSQPQPSDSTEGPTQVVVADESSTGPSTTQGVDAADGAPAGSDVPSPPAIAETGNGVPNPSPLPQPPTWYPQNIGSWVGKPWREVDLFRFMPNWPSGLDDAKRYVVFYSRTCEHCEAMFLDDLLIPLDAPITAIEIPADRHTMTGEGAWPMPKLDHIEFAHLPLGTTLWMMTPPLAVRIENGIITCATENDHKTCLGLP